MIGERLGRYIIEEEVGQGGMSVVYRGHDTVLDRTVAVKVLHPHLSNREESRKRFQREARAIAKLSHPNITQVYDFSETGAERSYIVMEFLEGVTLRQALEAHPPRHPEIAAMIVVKLCEALRHAHEIGIIHRDIKPENVMISREGTVKLTDFGIAQIVDAQAMTVTGALLGSPAHMSPEMIEGDEMDFRADLFSLGTVLYFAATGELPFTGRNAPLVFKAIVEGNYLDAEMVNPRVGRRLARIIDACLARNPADRYSSVGDLRADLVAWLEELGLADPDAELRAYFTNPEVYQDALRPRLLAALEQRGMEALRDRRVGAATDYFNRVLAIEPEHERVLKAIRRIDQRRKLLVWLGVAAGVLVVASAVVAISSLVGDDAEGLDDPSATPVHAPGAIALAVREAADDLAAARNTSEGATDEAARDATRKQGASLARGVVGSARGAATRMTTPAEDEDASADAVDDDAPSRLPIRVFAHTNGSAPLAEADAGADARDAGGLTDAAPAPERYTVTYRMAVFPPAARIRIVGVDYTTEQLRAGVRLESMPNEKIGVEVRHDLCIPKKFTFFAREDGQTIDQGNVALGWKPATLTVSSRDSKAAVFVFDLNDNKQLANTNANTAIPITITDPVNPQRKVRVQVISTTGGAPANFRSVSLTAGQAVQLNAPF